MPKKSAKRWDHFFAALKAFIVGVTVSDLIVVQSATHGQPMVLRYEATPLNVTQ